MAALTEPVRERSRRRRAKVAAPPRWSGRNSYSNFVALMKVTLPVVAVMLVGLIVFWNKIVPNPRLLAPDFSSIAPEFAQNLAMVNPRFDGIDKEGRPYSLTAAEALQTSTDANEIDLLQPSGDMTLPDGTWLSLSADRGLYRRKEELLDLAGNVSFFHDEGFELRSPDALVNFGAGIASGGSGVEGQGPAGTLAAEGFEFRDEGMTILFRGESQLVIYNTADASTNAGNPEPVNVAPGLEPVGLAPDAPPPPPAVIR
jgi:lipopolysaccharide export system protein LptC